MSALSNECSIVCPIREWCLVANGTADGMGRVLYGDIEDGSTGMITGLMQMEARLDEQVATGKVHPEREEAVRAEIAQARQVVTGMTGMLDQMIGMANPGYNFAQMGEHCEGRTVEDAPNGQVGMVAVYCGSAAISDDQRNNCFMVIPQDRLA